MSETRTYVIAGLLIAIATHFAIVFAMPRVLMNTAFDRVSAHAAHINQWIEAPRVTAASRTIVRPSPDLHYDACAYDLSHGPVVMRVAAWPNYWSLSLFAENSDNFYVIDDREAHDGAEVTLIRAGHEHPKDAARVVESPTERGIALVRRLAPTQEEFDAAHAASVHDVCALLR
jgi:uncharacterized membrane protein